MEIIIRIPVTMFRESKALRINRKIKPKEADPEIKIFFNEMLNVRVRAKYSGIKNESICTILA